MCSLPKHAPPYRTGGGFSNSESSGKLRCRYLWILPYLQDLFPCEFCSAMAFSVMGATKDYSFGTSIKSILFVPPDPKVGGIYTHLIVAIRAVVAYTHSIWNRSEMEHPACDMRPNLSVFSAPLSQVSIASKHSTNPDPTTICNSHFAEKSCWKGWGKSLLSKILGGNVATHSSVFCAFGLQAQRAFSLCG